MGLMTETNTLERKQNDAASIFHGVDETSAGQRCTRHRHQAGCFKINTEHFATRNISITDPGQPSLSPVCSFISQLLT